MKGMTIIVKTVADWVKVPIFVFGVYVIVFGDTSPGGGFAGGAVLASAYVLLMLAFGRETVKKELPPSLALKIACGSVFAFAAMATSGLFFDRHGFFWNFIYQEWLASKDIEIHFIESGTIAMAELAIGLAVGALVFLVTLSLSMCRFDILRSERE
jgi:multicomponent Na+:H+ antiporter subunit B